MTTFNDEKMSDRLKRELDIVQVARDLGVEVLRNGKQARCFNGSAHKHGDETPSLSFKSGNYFKCWACDVSGSVIDLYMQVNGVDFVQAVRELKERYLVGGGDYLQASTMTYKPPEHNEVDEVSPELIQTILGDFLDYCTGLTPEHMAYLTGNTRGLTEETIRRFRLASITDYNATSGHFLNKYGLADLQAVGLFSEKGNLVFYKHRLLIPYLQAGKVVYLKARRLDDGKPKYLNTGQETRLFNLDDLTTTAEDETIYITEGEFDCMVLVQNGFKAVGVGGVTNFKEYENANLFTRRDVVICYDNDESGKVKSEELGNILQGVCKSVEIKYLPDDIKDITDYFLS